MVYRANSHGRRGCSLGPLLVVFVIRFVASTKNATFLWLSDLHFDPFYGSSSAAGEGPACRLASAKPLGQMGCDTPIALLEQTIQYAVNITAANPPSFILVTGDLVRHGTDDLQNPVETTRSILRNVSDLLTRSFPATTSFLPTVGNNDVTPDYYLNVDDPRDMLLELLTQGLETLFATDEERTSFSAGGYLARNVSSTLTILSLNTIIYSSSHYPETRETDPLGQFSWLRAQLTIAQTSQRRVYIVGHIPPAVGSYRHSQLWQDEYVDEYYDLIEPFRLVIAAQCFGHLHADEFRVIHPKEAQPWPLLLASSVTPVYGSHPSIRDVIYDVETNTVLDYDTWFLDLEHNPSTWQQEISFRESFPMARDLSGDSLASIVTALNESIHQDDALIWKALKRRQHVSLDEPDCTDVDCRRAWLCTIESATAARYSDCLLQLANSSAGPMLMMWRNRRDPQERWIAVGILLALIVACTVCVPGCDSRRFLRRRHYRKHLSQDEGGDIVMTSRNEAQMTPTVQDEGPDDDDEEVPMELPEMA
jgi:Calcineurin-like phosphoesterase